MKNSTEQRGIDDLLLNVISALAQAYPVINTNKDPRLLLEFILSDFVQLCPVDNLIAVVKHSQIVCSLGHANESVNCENLLYLPDLVNNGQIKDAIDSLKAQKSLIMNCKFCNKTDMCTITIPWIELPCFLIISLNFQDGLVLPEKFCYENSSYELFGVIKKVTNQGMSNKKYIAMTKDDGIWWKYDNEISECTNINFAGCYLAFYMSI